MQLIEEEMVADNALAVFTDEKAMTKLAKKNRTLLEKIHDFFNQFIDKLKAIKAKLSKSSAVYATINQDIDYLEQSADKIRTMLDDVQSQAKKQNVNTKYSKNTLDSEGNELTEQQQEYFEDVAKELRDENGRIKPFYHGTARADRVGYYFDPKRATSGPMAYFTDNEKIANNYSRNKADTSLTYDSDYDSYDTQFRKNGKPIAEYWNSLNVKNKNELTKKIMQVTLDDEDNIVLDKNNKYGIGNFNDYELHIAKGNPIKVLVDGWLNDGTLWNEEERFIDVLNAVGISDVEYKNPDYREEKVYKVYLNITKPFVTTEVSEDFISGLNSYLENTDLTKYNNVTSNADMCDKNNIDIDEWIDRLVDDIKNHTTHSWTSIPDVVTDFLKSNGYDGIIDEGGKGGGEGHTVAIPFYSNQIKLTDNLNPTDNLDIRYSKNTEFGKEIEKWYKDGRANGKTFIIGDTSDVLQGLGAIDNQIYFYSDKINNILKKHNDTMSLDIIKRVPDIIENPALIMSSHSRSQENNTRLLMFGNIKNQDVKPIMCVLDLQPYENGMIISDMQKLTSAYPLTRTPKNTEDYLRQNDILYVTKNKKIATKLVRQIGFYMPIAFQQSGYIGNITYNNRSVNIKGKPFFDAVKVDNDKHSRNTRLTLDDNIEDVNEAFLSAVKVLQNVHIDDIDLSSEVVNKAEKAAKHIQDEVKKSGYRTQKMTGKGSVRSIATELSKKYGKIICKIYNEFFILNAQFKYFKGI